MGKYDPLAHYLGHAREEGIDASFAQLEKILGFRLPDSAYRYQAWWANETHGSHSHSRSWQEAGWETCQVNLPRKTVRFERRQHGGRVVPTQLPPASADPDINDLWRKAGDISGISDRKALERDVLKTYIRRAAAKRLIELGGTMPDFEAAPRERPFG